jgi:hypothetical protein
MMGVTMFLLGCVLDAALGLAFTEFGANGGSVLGSGYIQVSPWYFYAVALVGTLIQPSVVFFGAGKYEQDGKMEADVIASAIFFALPILYVLMYVGTEFLFTRRIVQAEFAMGVTILLNFAFILVSAITLVIEVFSETTRKQSCG